MKRKKQHNPSRKLLNFGGLLLAAAFLVVLGCSDDDTQRVVNFTQLTMQDEFDSDGAPDSSIWSYDIGTGENGWGNSELQYYTDRTENVTVNNGYLIITANKENFEGAGYTS
ncbi:MAG: glycoside hydrolase family 16 protein, partial [Robiginitalea sp.]|nr:glycoside hydrolase family 16 protein [Robiginitalea sp.]